MERRLWEIVDLLSENEYKTSSSLGESLGISEKTVRTRIKELNEHVMKHSAEVYSKPRYGYCLKINNQEEWVEYLKRRGEEKSEIPTDSKDRIYYLLAVFLFRKDYVKIEELCNFLYVSNKTLSIELKKLEYLLKNFHIELERKPYYGIRAKGEEFFMRICILHNQLQHVSSFFEVRKEKEKVTEYIGEILLALSKEYGIRFSEFAFQNTVLYIYISISRMKKGFYINPIQIQEEEKEKKEFHVAKQILQKMQDTEKFEFTEEEIYYTGIYIAGKRFMGSDLDTNPNFVISKKTDRLVSRILNEVFLTYNLDLRDDLNLRMMLNQHLIPLEIRLKYNIPIENVELDDVKEKYFFSFIMAQHASAILEEAFKKPLPVDEIACIALYFALAMEEKKTSTKKKNNILLVCVSGKASSQMLKYRFRQEFGEYVDEIKVCGMYDFEQCDLSNIDYIFSTVPIYQKVSVPIMEIKEFLEGSDIMQVRKFLQLGDYHFLEDYYKEKYFFSDIDKTTKEEVIDEMCNRLKKITSIPEGFKESILKREEFGSTDFGNMVAIPHPCQIMTEETIVAVAVLKKEIQWSNHMVRVVILTSLSTEKTDNTQKFYDVTTKFLVNRLTVLKLLEKPEYGYFISLLCEER